MAAAVECIACWFVCDGCGKFRLTSTVRLDVTHPCDCGHENQIDSIKYRNGAVLERPKNILGGVK